MKVKKIVLTFIILNMFFFQIAYAKKKKVSSIAFRKVQLIKYIKAEEFGAPVSFQGPQSLYVDKENQLLYVVAKQKGPIYKFDLQDEYKFVSEIGSDAGLSSAVLDLKTNKNGDLYAVDSEKNKLFVFNSQGDLRKIIDVKENRKNKTGLGVTSMDIGSTGDIFMTDKGGQGIQVLDPEGNYMYQIVKASVGKEEFGFPSVAQLKINSNNEIYMLDNMMCKIIKFNTKGKTLGIFGGRGDIVGTFVDATAITIDQKDRVYVLEQMTGTIQVFDKDGNFLHILVDEKEERLILQSPIAIDIDYTGRIYILERKKDRVAVLKFVD